MKCRTHANALLPQRFGECTLVLGSTPSSVKVEMNKTLVLTVRQRYRRLTVTQGGNSHERSIYYVSKGPKEAVIN